ncbi:DUF2207 domain-containing protein [Agromyces mediolanus]|uniref:DUF2207 domain-containing protein n=1 Tax=Agromyces mediolanus TaxID=41986 RepID=UPI001E558DA5|nr:DUF2207 domain-containing protein [Agromyces mediolanus]MCD1572014.1 DUF2207 domain-containing protein [Agromyces mediolanus]
MSRRMPRTAAALVAGLLAGAGLALAGAPLLAFAGQGGTTAPALAPAAPAAPAGVSVLPTGTDDFVFDSFDAVYELGTDADGRSVLDTTETLVAVFPEFDQNRGIRRAIPLSYDGHPVDLEVRSVTDENGTPRAYSTEPDDDDEFLLVSIAGDEYVHGRQSYVIEYRQHNVTHVPDDRPIDELYWDVNGTGWAQPFGRVSAEVRLSGAAAAGFTGEGACYQGPSGSATPCTALELGDEVALATAEGLGPYENLTVALAFEPGTFVPRDDAFTSSPAALAGAGGALLALGAAGAAIVARATRWRDHPGRGTIIAQYEPPPGLSVMEAAELVGQPGKGVTATILQLAVQHRLRVVELGPKRFAVEYGGGEGPDPDADQLLRELFATSGRRELKQQDTALGKKLLALRSGVRSRVVAEGLRRTPPVGPRLLLGLLALLGGIVAVVFGIVALDQAMGGGWPVLGLVLGILAVLAAAFAVIDVRPLTEPGRAAKDHLEGLKVYLRLAEADRIRMLQSPEGALRVGGPEAVLKLHEKLLPYAVLFGIEREWSRVLAAEYAERGAQPDWYAGRGPFDALAFSAGVSAFSTTASSSWSGSSSSSSSSGSGGGGASGGGGGGGGGGGL